VVRPTFLRGKVVVMDPRRFEAFLVVAEELHFARAAARLHVAPSALSQQIRRLEAELGAPLFRRSSRRVELTAAGRALQERAPGVLEAIAEAGRSTRAAAAGQEGRLTVAFAGSITYGLMPALVRAFRESHPRVEVGIRGEQVTADQVEGLLDGVVDVGFLRPPVGSPHIVLEHLRVDQLVAVLPEDHPLASLERVPLEGLAGDPFITYPSTAGASTLAAVMGACLDAGFSPRVVQEGRESHTIVGLVAAGIGVALVPAPLRQLRMPGVVYRPLVPPVPEVPLAIAWRRAGVSPLIERFVDLARHVVGSSPD